MAEIKGCSEEGFDSMLEVGFFAKIADQNSNGDLIFFRERFDDDATLIGLKPIFNSEFIKRVKTMMSNNMSTLSAEDVSFTLSVNNDAVIP